MDRARAMAAGWNLLSEVGRPVSVCAEDGSLRRSWTLSRAVVRGGEARVRVAGRRGYTPLRLVYPRAEEGSA